MAAESKKKPLCITISTPVMITTIIMISSMPPVLLAVLRFRPRAGLTPRLTPEVVIMYIPF